MSRGPTSTPSSAPSSGPGHLGPYRLLHEVGSGGMGVVHLALDPEGRAVAIKVLRPHLASDPQARARLDREADTLRRVRSPRVAEVLDTAPDADPPYIVTQFVPAPPLDGHVDAVGPLTGSALVRLGLGLGEALSAIHRAGVVHRDLKPGNVLVLDGDPVVIDFGIAQIADDVRFTSTGLVMGTPGYLSPEVIDGAPISVVGDWWGWAATMLFAATGRPPFGTGSMDVVLSRVNRGRADLVGVPEPFAALLAAALDPDPEARPTPRRIREALQAMERGTAGEAALRAPDRGAEMATREDAAFRQDRDAMADAAGGHRGALAARTAAAGAAAGPVAGGVAGAAPGAGVGAVLGAGAGVGVAAGAAAGVRGGPGASAVLDAERTALLEEVRALRAQELAEARAADGAGRSRTEDADDPFDPFAPVDDDAGADGLGRDEGRGTDRAARTSAVPARADDGLAGDGAVEGGVAHDGAADGGGDLDDDWQLPPTDLAQGPDAVLRSDPDGRTTPVSTAQRRPAPAPAPGPAPAPSTDAAATALFAAGPATAGAAAAGPRTGGPSGDDPLEGDPFGVDPFGDDDDDRSLRGGRRGGWRERTTAREDARPAPETPRRQVPPTTPMPARRGPQPEPSGASGPPWALAGPAGASAAPTSALPTGQDHPAAEAYGRAPGPAADWAVPPARPAPPVEHQQPLPEAPARRLPPAPRTGTLALVLLALVVTAAVAPVWALIVLAAGSVLARTVDRVSGSLLRRRAAHGERSSDSAVAALVTPGHLLSAVVVSVVALLLPLAMGVSAGFLVGALIDPTGLPTPGLSLLLAAGALTALLTAWWGPASGSLRRGTRQVVRATSPSPRAQVVAAGLLALVVVAGAIVVTQSAGQPDWSPLTGPPLQLGAG